MTDSTKQSGPVILQPVREDPADLTPVDSPSAFVHLARDARDKAKLASDEVSNVREDLREYTRRDLDEHAELRSAVGALSNKVDGIGGHVSDMRVSLATATTQLGTFVDTVNAERSRAAHGAEVRDDAVVADGLDKRKHRRALLVAMIALGSATAGVIGALLHYLAS